LKYQCNKLSAELILRDIKIEEDQFLDDDSKSGLPIIP